MRRLRRCRVHFAEQHRRNQQKQESWQAHGSLPELLQTRVAGGPPLGTIMTVDRVLLERHATEQSAGLLEVPRPTGFHVLKSLSADSKSKYLILCIKYQLLAEGVSAISY
jgi:hypothetical protein